LVAAMKWVSVDAGVLRVSSVADGDRGTSSSGEGGTLATGAVHELLFDRATTPPPGRLALHWARDAIARGADANAPLVWLDVAGTFYPPAAAVMGVPLSRLCVVRTTADDVARTAAECLRCRGVAGVVAPVPTRLTRVEARRLQLAAEQGGGVGVLMRPLGRGDDVYAAATRWLVAPAPAPDRAAQRWRVELLHGHGGRVAQSFFVESHRARPDLLQDVPAADGVNLRPPAELVDRSPRATTA
jgi:protein ImuA